MSTGRFRRTRGKPARPDGGVASDASIGIFSDVHGNGVGLDAVLAELERAQVDRLVCLGDLVEGGPQPDHCLRRVQELDCPVVDGNCDHWLVEYYREPEEPERSDIGAWARARLGDAGLAALAAFPDPYELELGDAGRLLCVHGTPTSRVDRVEATATDDELLDLLGDARALAAGHTHEQWQRRVGDRLVLNPGRVGKDFGALFEGDTRDLDGVAEYAILSVDGSRLSADLRRVPYSLAELRRVTLESGMPHAAEAAGRLDVS
jgi:predicted phosphodiesterase